MDAWTKAMLLLRGVRDPCPTCEGSGVRGYASTSTWRGGAGGCMMTTDVCDVCWGSGDAYRKGVDLRKMRDEEEKRIAEEAVKLLATVSGVGLANGAVRDIIDALEELAVKSTRARKKLYNQWTYNMAKGLARHLRKAIGEIPEEEDDE